MNTPFGLPGLSREQLQQMQTAADQLRAAQPALDALKAAVSGPSVEEMRRHLAETVSWHRFAEQVSATATLAAADLRPLGARDLTDYAPFTSPGRHPAGSIGNELDRLRQVGRDSLAAACDFTKPGW